ncbi:HAD-IIIA family hydrolase [Ferrimonas pelagia]|uniref:HAD-IA family hydrolase n=1 Tax=Ferrimonas pelagia TaxID=1177826 RepID=A0ABP9EI26_9GAMM
MPSRYELVIFDWDGTLMDTVGRIVSSWQSASRDLNVTVPDSATIRRLIGLSMEACIEQVAPHLSCADKHQFRERYRGYYLQAEQVPAPLFDGVPELLAQMNAQGHQLAVATGKARHGLERVLDSSGLRHYFPYTRSASDTESKPAPHMVLELCEEAKVSPQRTLVVGDAWFDLEMARRAGADSIGVRYGAGEADRLLEAKPKALIDRPLELLRWL